MHFFYVHPLSEKYQLIYYVYFFRQDVQCFGDDTCYSLAFGVPAALMLIATIILVLGKNMYVHKPPQGSVMTQVIGSIWVCNNLKYTAMPVRKGTLTELVLLKLGLFEGAKSTLKMLPTT